MSAEWADFPSGDTGLYGTNTGYMLAGTPWVAVDGALIEDPDPNVSGNVFQFEGGSNNNPFLSCSRLALPNPHTAPGASARLWATSFGEISQARPALIAFSIADNTAGYFLRQELNGALTVVRRTSSSTHTDLATTTVPVTTTNAWAHISFTVDFTTGVYSVEIEGDSIAALSGTDGSPIGGSAFFYQCSSRTGTTGDRTNMRMKDLFVWNQGGTENNTHPGPITVYRRPVNSDISSGWSRSTGTSDYPLVDEVPPNDADYIYAPDTLPSPSIMGLQDLPDDVVSIRGVMLINRSRKTDGGDGKLQQSISPDGATWDDGSDRSITTAFTFWHDWSELNPATAAPWLPGAFNGAQFKLNRTL